MSAPAALIERPPASHPTADAGFAVYVHWPFCLAKCPYCDFNSHVRLQPPDQARYIAAFRHEIAHRAALAPGRTVSSIFFGGGTPSLMEGRTVGAILDAIGEHWAVAPDCEVSLEANPTSVEAGRFADFRAAGINRVSLGVQALNDADLKALGRMHSAEEALAAVTCDRGAGADVDCPCVCEDGCGDGERCPCESASSDALIPAPPLAPPQWLTSIHSRLFCTTLRLNSARYIRPNRFTFGQ